MKKAITTKAPSERKILQELRAELKLERDEKRKAIDELTSLRKTIDTVLQTVNPQVGIYSRSAYDNRVDPSSHQKVIQLGQIIIATDKEYAKEDEGTKTQTETIAILSYLMRAMVGDPTLIIEAKHASDHCNQNGGGHKPMPGLDGLRGMKM